MKYLILGVNGMAGHTIALYLKEKNNEVYGFGRQSSPFMKTIIGNALEINVINDIIKNGNYDYIINCLGILNKEAENHKSLSCYINSFIPHHLVEITQDTKTKIVHISTDCVFSGNKGKYSEDDLRDGITFYDRSKALGEIEDQRNITLRSSIIGPDLNQNGIGLFNWFMLEKNNILGYNKSIWTGQTTLQLAKIIEYCCINNVSGLYNSVPDDSISKYELLKLINKYSVEKKEILKVDGLIVDKSLIKKKSGLNYKYVDYDFMIFELFEWLKKYKNLYPHYGL